MARVGTPRLGIAGAALFGAALLGGVLLTAGCQTSAPATLYTPYTGLRISSASLFAGYTCGLGPGQVYAYVAVVSDANASATQQPAGLPIANVYPCGSDGAFQNLPGSGSYNVIIYVYDREAFPAELACMPGSCALPPASELGNPTWTTSCSGVVEASQNELVLCGNLTPGPTATMPEAGVSPSGDDGGADATIADAATGDVTDATIDAGDGAATPPDGGDGGDMDGDMDGGVIDANADTDGADGGEGGNAADASDADTDGAADASDGT